MPPKAVVADLSHYSWGATSPDFVKARAGGLQGVIYKASEGATVTDATYAKTRTQAEAAGLLWGAYHFGTNADPKAQSDAFLKAANPAENTLIALDFEDCGANRMSAKGALDFLHEVEKRLGRKPKLYTGGYMYQLFGKTPQPDFAPYALWWSRYADAPEVHPTWAKYWLWQYTDGHSGPKPHDVSGFGFCDISTFDGAPQDLIVSWAG